MSATESPSRSPRRPGRRRPAPLLLRRQRRRRRALPELTADWALHELVQRGDLFKVGHYHYLVAPLSAWLVDILIEAMGASEDHEEGGDDEPSAGRDDLELEDEGEPSLCGISAHDQRGVSGADLELDDSDDEPSGDTECALGWANEGPQGTLGWATHEDERELGWRNTGSQSPLVDRVTPWHAGLFNEGDGDCDREHSLGWSDPQIAKSGQEIFVIGDQRKLTGGPEGDVLDKGELDPCDQGEPEEYLDG